MWSLQINIKFICVLIRISWKFKYAARSAGSPTLLPRKGVFQMENKSEILTQVVKYTSMLYVHTYCFCDMCKKNPVL
jgi:hypothetical protein